MSEHCPICDGSGWTETGPCRERVHADERLCSNSDALRSAAAKGPELSKIHWIEIVGILNGAAVLLEAQQAEIERLQREVSVLIENGSALVDSNRRMERKLEAAGIDD